MMERLDISINKELLEDVACDLEGYAMHIREFLRGETETLPMRWHIQDAFEKFKAAVEYA